MAREDFFFTLLTCSSKPNRQPKAGCAARRSGVKNTWDCLRGLVLQHRVTVDDEQRCSATGTGQPTFFLNV